MKMLVLTLTKSEIHL